MKSYTDIIQKILDEGVWKDNRTGIRTKSITGHMFEHDMRTGFPLLTTKKMAHKAIRVELEGFIKGISSKKWFQDRGCHIWDEWASRIHKPEEMSEEEWKTYQKEVDDLGPIGYSHGWRNFNGHYKPIPNIYTGLNREIELDNSADDPNNLVGKEFDGKFGKYTVYKYCGSSANHIKLYGVKFHKTGYVKDNIQKPDILKMSIFDPYFPNVCGVACLGEYEKVAVDDKKNVEKLKNSWKQMIHRCYNEQHESFDNYGAVGTWVHDRWMIFANYLEDVQKIEGWRNKSENWKLYALDKDISESNCYSKNTCLWVTRSINSSNTKVNYYFDVVDPEGKEYKNNIGLSSFCKLHKLSTKAVEASIKANSFTHKGWKFTRKSNFKSNINPKGVDQLKFVIETLKKDPTSRRMICMAWNPSQNDQMALPPCHFGWQLLSDGEYVDLLWNQRSVDTPLGLPFNIASYALLLTLVGKECNLIPRKLIGFLADVHIYENQMDGVMEQLKRESLPLPTIEIPNFTSIFDWTYDQFELKNYQSHEKISFPVAV